MKWVRKTGTSLLHTSSPQPASTGGKRVNPDIPNSSLHLHVVQKRAATRFSRATCDQRTLFPTVATSERKIPRCFHSVVAKPTTCLLLCCSPCEEGMYGCLKAAWTEDRPSSSSTSINSLLAIGHRTWSSDDFKHPAKAQNCASWTTNATWHIFWQLLFFISLSVVTFRV